MRRRPPRSTQSRSSAASDVYKRQEVLQVVRLERVDEYEVDPRFERGQNLEGVSFHDRNRLVQPDGPEILPGGPHVPRIDLQRVEAPGGSLKADPHVNGAVPDVAAHLD